MIRRWLSRGIQKSKPYKVQGKSKLASLRSSQFFLEVPSLRKGRGEGEGQGEKVHQKGREGNDGVGGSSVKLKLALVFDGHQFNFWLSHFFTM